MTTRAVPVEISDGLPAPRRYWAMVAIWLAMGMAVIDTAIANVALPTIGRELGATPAVSVWVVNAYQIAIVMLLLPLAALGEIVGYRRVYGAGVAMFVVASLGCVLAPGLTTLAACRFAQGLGAAAVMGMNGALVRFTYPRARLGRGIAYNAVVVAAASAAGPTVAGAVLSVASWRWLFAVNVPIGLASLLIGATALPASHASPRPFDGVSALLNAATFGALFAGSASLAQGEPAWRGLAAMGVALVLGVVLVTRARGRREPLMPVDLLAVPLLRMSYAASCCAFVTEMVGLVALPFYVQARFHYSQASTGLMMTAFPAGLTLGAPLAGRLVERVSPAVLGGAGMALLAAGYAAIAGMPANWGAAVLAIGLAVSGFGFGFFQTPNARLVLGRAPVSRSGAAAALLALSRLAGQTLGAVTVALLLRLVGTASALPFTIAALMALVAATVSLSRSRGEA